MTAGRPRKPTKLHVINGTDRPCRRNNDEPEPDVVENVPDPPEFLSDTAKEEWYSISVKLHNIGVLTDIDLSMLALYCQAYGRWVDAEKKITPANMVVKTKNGNPINNPYLNIANTSMRDCHRYLAEFGMTPSSRTKIRVDGSAKKKNKFLENKGRLGVL